MQAKLAEAKAIWEAEEAKRAGWAANEAEEQRHAAEEALRVAMAGAAAHATGSQNALARLANGSDICQVCYPPLFHTVSISGGSALRSRIAFIYIGCSPEP